MGKMKDLFSRKEVVLDPVIVEAVIGRDELDNALRCEGYEMALRDFSHGLRGCNSFALLSVSPCVQQMQSKLRKMKGE